jgi:hypothetical protein
MWWYFALFTNYRGNQSLQDFLLANLTASGAGGVHATIVLYGVPLLVLLFILNGPSKKESIKPFFKTL